MHADTSQLQAILTYAKAFPQLTFEELEEVFRDSKMNTHLIAKEQAVSDTHTIVNLQGKVDMKYSVSIQFSDKPRRAAFAVQRREYLASHRSWLHRGSYGPEVFQLQPCVPIP